ncbi:NAD(P)-binding domain-containing protein [Amycolatopsis sp. cg13]|uniref:NAD(P)-binding domain-containing protein n=1 Tax=Amycolatopsis sp. cg13 TaxID=3238807 RepID=UPI003524D2C3
MQSAPRAHHRRDGEQTERTTSHDVAVLGCGLMGSALARSLAGGGKSVAGWNRTHHRADALASTAIAPVREIDGAVHAAPLVLACLTTYDSALVALEPVSDLTGITLVSVGSAAPSDLETFGVWGSILGYPEQIGTEGTAILCSGSETARSEHSESLTLLTPVSVRVSSDVKIASVLNTGLVGMFLVPAVSAYVEAATCMLGQGVDQAFLETLTPAAFGSIQAETARVATAIASGDFTTDQATIATYAQALDGAIDIAKETGLNPPGVLGRDREPERSRRCRTG